MRCPAESGQSHASGIWTAKLGVVMTLAALSLGGCADLPVFHAPAQFAGFATTPKEGQDFVRESHPEKTEFTSVGVEPAKPPAKPRDAKGVKELQAELEAQRDTGHAIIQKLSPPGTAAATPQTPEEKIKAKQKQKEEAARKAKDKQAGDAAQPASQ